MALNIVTLNSNNWKVYTLEDGEYRETPKQFKFDVGSQYFTHVDKDMENVFSRGWNYVFSRTLSVKELKEIYLEHYLNVWGNKYEDAKKELERFNKIKASL